MGLSITSRPHQSLRNPSLRTCALGLLLAMGFASSLQAAFLPCVVPNCPMSGGRATGQVDLLHALPPARASIPPSLRDAPLIFAGDVNRVGSKNSAGTDAPVCDVNGMCASFPDEQTDVVAWIGFKYLAPSQEFFVATFGQEAVHLGNGLYFTPFWDKRHFWIEIADGVVPLAIQQRYVGTDPATGNDFFSADYVGYRQPGVSYSEYLFGFSVSALILEVDSAGTVVDFFIELYDENDDYVGDVNLELGDELGTFFFGFQQEDPTTITLLSIEDLAEVTREPDFFLEEWYPGTTFPCTHCGDLDLSQEQFFFMFEGASDDRWNYTEPLPIPEASVVEVPLGLPTQVTLITLLGMLGFLTIRRLQ